MLSTSPLFAHIPLNSLLSPSGNMPSWVKMVVRTCRAIADLTLVDSHGDSLNNIGTVKTVYATMVSSIIHHSLGPKSPSLLSDDLAIQHPCIPNPVKV
jgi:hypothetical protein